MSDENQLKSKMVKENLLEFNWYDVTSNSNKEVTPSSQVFTSVSNVKRNIPSEVTDRYLFSNYVIDPNKFRFLKVIRILAYVLRFIECIKSKKTKKIQHLDDEEIEKAKMYFFRKATEEIKFHLKESKYQNISMEKNGVLYYTGRILPTQEIKVVANMTNVMKDLVSTSFCVPLVDCHSPIAYSSMNEVHWFDKIAKHSGIETVLRQVLRFVYVIGGRDLAKRIRKTCERCRYLAKRTIDVSMGPVSSHNMIIAPAFYVSQIDLAGPFKAYSPHQKRKTIKVWFVVFVCSTTSATKIKVMDDYGSAAFIQAFIRFSCEVGYPKHLLIDEGSQLVSSCENIRINFTNLQNIIYSNWKIDFNMCPVGGHNFHGRVERKIKEIKISIEKNVQIERLSILQWETLGSEISNTINDLPLAIGNVVSEFEAMDLLTPNRLILGRNNNRSPIHPLAVSNNYQRIIKDNEKIFTTWFENWLISHVPKLMVQPKWYLDDRDVKVGDVIIFLKHESTLSNTYQYGMVKEIFTGTDGKIRKVNVKYRNYNENVDRVTTRSVRNLVLIHPVDELNLIQELGEIASYIDSKRKINDDLQ